MTNRLKEHRKAAGLTLQELADACGTSKGHLHCLEGPNGNPALRTAYKIAAVLGKSVTEIWPDTTKVVEQVITVRRVIVAAHPEQEPKP